MARAIKPSDVEKSRNMRTGIRTRNSRVKRNSGPYFIHRQIVLIIIMLIIFMGSGISYVWSSFEGTQIGYDLSRLQQKELRLKDLNRKLKLELATLKSPQNLEDAIRGMGFRAVSQDQLVTLP